MNQARQKQQLFTQGKEKNFAKKKWQKTIQIWFNTRKNTRQNDVYYIEHREGTNASRLRKDPKKTEKDELITMLETINRAIKRSTSKSKLSQLKRIIKHLVKKYKDLGEEFIE